MCRACRTRVKPTPTPTTAYCAPCATVSTTEEDDGTRPPLAERYDAVVVGAGVAGTSFARTLAESWSDRRDDETSTSSDDGGAKTILLLDQNACAKTVSAVERVTRRVESLRVRETPLKELGGRARAVARGVVGCDANRRVLTLEGGIEVGYDTLCVATGAVPRCPLPEASDGSVDVFEVRDVESVDALARRLESALARTKRIALVGNGGIALELVDALCGRGIAMDGIEACELVWVVKHDGVGDAFFDVDAADFFTRVLETRAKGGFVTARDDERDWSVDDSTASTTTSMGDGTKRRRIGAAAGPEWVARFRSRCADGTELRRMKFRIVKNVTLIDAHKTSTSGINVLKLSDGSTIEVDAVVAAAGAEPRCDWLPEDVAPRSTLDGGILVDECMRTVGPYADSIVAVGDACSMESRARRSDVPWFQMRLWSQARQSGSFAARVVAGECDADALGFNFELFTHVTKFFGLKVILLGLYNAQKLEGVPEEDVVTYQREDVDEADADACRYVRVLLVRGRMMGAVLIGDTDLEETFENLIMDGIDLSRFGPEILDPEFDVEDYFD